MKIQKLVYSALLLAVVLQNGYSQKAQVEAADKKYEDNSFVDAIATYERIAEKGYKNEKMFQNLGNAYYFNAELPKAEKWYGELFAMNKNQEAEYYYRYAQSLKSTGKYDKSNEMMDQFNKKSGNDKRAILYASHKNYLEVIKANSGRYTIENAGINSESSDYGSALVGNKLIFASAREGSTGKVFEQTNESFTDLYASEISPNGKLEEPKPFGGKNINSKFHESTPVFTKDGQTVYFTRNNFLDGKKGKNADKVTMLKLYKATLVGDSWDNVTELPFNSNNYSVAHPALSPDGKTLYFASDMPGTLGQSDLYKVAIKNDGSFGPPVNLGATINTEARESFPFISDDNKLYFASDGRPGLGGFDVFVSKIEQDGSFKEVQNVAAPINGPQDDFGFIIDSKTGTGFFSSNRAGGKGYDDIYKFAETRCNQQVEGVVTDLETNMVLPNAKLSLFNEKFELQKEFTSDAQGHYAFEAECGKTYYVRATAANYVTKESKVATSTITGKTNQPMALEKVGCQIVIGGDLAKCFGIKVIYFDLNKANITKEAAFELEKILDAMKQHPKMKIDVRSHTDSRQSTSYNEALSNKRAKSTIDWLVKNGINANRLTGKGYGESQLVNKCSDGVECSEEEHQANRRSEFIVTAMN